MKRKFLCLLLALTVVMSVVPLTALAEEKQVPEEYLGKYEVIPANSKDARIVFEIHKDKASISIDDFCYGEDLPLTGFDDTKAHFEKTFGSGQCVGRFSIDFETLSAELYSDELWETHVRMNNIKKVSDPTGSTLSAGSDLIIPIAAAVLLIGAVIFIGKRKKEKEIQ